MHSPCNDYTIVLRSFTISLIKHYSIISYYCFLIHYYVTLGFYGTFRSKELTYGGNMFEKIKTYALIILLVLIGLFAINSVQKSCKPITPSGSVTITPLKTFTPNALDNSSVPFGNTVITVLHPTPVVVRPWQDANEHIVVSADSKCSTCSVSYTQVVKVTNKLGFSFQPKFYLGYNKDGLTIGYNQGIFRYGRYTFNGLVSFPYVGLSIAADLTNNFFTFIGGSVTYVAWDNKSDPNTYYIPVSQLTNVRPIVGIGWNF